MAIKLTKDESVFRNELIYLGDAKAVNVDYTLLNLGLLLRFHGKRPKFRAQRQSYSSVDINSLLKVIQGMEETDKHLEGFIAHQEAAEMWLRANLVNMVYRGNVEKENVASLRPIHLESYRVRNARHARDYNSADQVYMMLSATLSLRDELMKYLEEGWDQNSKKIATSSKLDVDSLGILLLIQKVNVSALPQDQTFSRIRPILQKQAELCCDDIHRLLVYKRDIPRSVIIEYIKILITFHQSLYFQKVVHLLPEMIRQGKVDVEDNWNAVVDMTDNLESKISKLAIHDAELVFNKLQEYIRSTYKVNTVLRKLNLDRSNSANLDAVLLELKQPSADFETYFQARWAMLKEAQDDEDRQQLDDLTKYEDTYFEKYIQALMSVRSSYQYRYSRDLIDSLTLKNEERGMMAQGRSRRHPRRFVMGTRLLETLVQLLVLQFDSNKNEFFTQALSIEELIQTIRDRYGLVINGIGEERFNDADIQTVLAFRENVEAFKKKLRQIGFYNNLSDAYILQKVNPRYSIQP
ncbi:MAG: hypothetical protein J0L99_21465 [Chitinophagales bacterium]|nr:hypothetical protein [Chitinophagales bacterium]